MADADTEDDVAPPSGATPDIGALLQGLLGQANQPPARAAPVDTDANAPTSFAGLLGERVAGGPPADVDLTQAQREAAGRRALLHFGAGLMSVGPFDTLGQGLAAGMRGAEASQYSSEGIEAQRDLAAQVRQQQQFQNQLDVAKTGVASAPLLQVQLALERLKALQRIAGGGGGGGGGAPGAPAVPAGAYGAGGPGADIKVPPEYMPFFQEASKRTGIPVETLIAQVRQESGFNPGAVGGAGEIGLGQIKPSTATNPGFGLAPVDPAKLKDPRTNINFTADYLRARMGAGADPSDPAAIRAGLLAYNGGGDPNYVNNVTRYLPKLPTSTAAAAPPAPSTQATRLGGTATAGPAAGPPASPAAPPAQPVGDLGLVRNPDGTVGTPPPGAPAAAPPPGPTKGPALPDGTPISVDEYRAGLPPVPLPASIQAQVAAAGQLSPAQQQIIANERQAALNSTKDPGKALQEVGQHQAELIQENQQKAQDAVNAFNKDVADKQAAVHQTLLANANAVRLKQIEAQNAENLEHIKAGTTAAQKQQDVDAAEATATQKEMDTKASGAQDVNSMLANLGPQLKNLPHGFTAQLIENHPDVVPFLQKTGWITGQEADASQILRGLTNYMSVVLKPAGNGALRQAEMDRFQTVLPTMLQSQQGQQQALGYLLNMNDRIIAEADYARKQFRQPVDPNNPNSLQVSRVPVDFWSKMNQPVSQGGLGPAVPHYTGSMQDGAAYQSYVQSQPAGRPYYEFYKTIDPTTKQPRLKERLAFAPQQD